VVKKMTPRDEVIAFFKARGEDYKLRLIDDMSPTNEDLGLYYHQEYVDMCRGPHVPNTGFLKAFKLMKVAGAYWRGDSKNEHAAAHLRHRLGRREAAGRLPAPSIEEAEKRDHRKLGKQLDLFHLQEEAPGLVFWHPKGWSCGSVSSSTCAAVYRDRLRRGALPADPRRRAVEASGHWDNYKDNMFFTESEKRTYAVKPMNCPATCRSSTRACTATATCRSATANSAPATATSRPARCTASCACAASPRTTATSSAPRTRSSPR
jgi:threonyl-tRNA synthetase